MTRVTVEGDRYGYLLKMVGIRYIESVYIDKYSLKRNV